MALLDVLKKKKNPPKAKTPVSQKPAEEKKRIKKSGEYGRILKIPHVSEKSTDKTGKNQYIFRVFPLANKNSVKNSIEGLYGVDVETVRIINVPGKKRRIGRSIGWKEGYKKAIIKIKEGQKIEVSSG